MQCKCIPDIRQVLLRDGFVVIPKFFEGQDLQTLQYEAEHVLEATGAYNGGDGPGGDDIAKSRGCIFEVLRSYPAGPVAGAAAAAAADGPSGRAPSAVRLPGLGLLASPRLHALVRSALGFLPSSCPLCGAITSGSPGSRHRQSQAPSCGAGCVGHYRSSPGGEHHQHHEDDADRSSHAGCCRGTTPGIEALTNSDAAAAAAEAAGRAVAQTADSAVTEAVAEVADASADAGEQDRHAPAPNDPAFHLAGGGGPYLFNEQFIVKARGSGGGGAFGWHRDSDWCRDRPEYEYSPYISVWTALDDMTPGNGTLAVSPGTHVLTTGGGWDEREAEEHDRRGKRQRRGCGPTDSEGGAARAVTDHAGGPAHPGDSGRATVATATTGATRPTTSGAGGRIGSSRSAAALQGAEEQRGAAVAATTGAGAAAAETHLLVPAGTTVILLDTVLHASGPNWSRHMRRVWMPQFSAGRIVRRRDATPVALAVPLSALPPPSNGSRGRAERGGEATNGWQARSGRTRG